MYTCIYFHMLILPFLTFSVKDLNKPLTLSIKLVTNSSHNPVSHPEHISIVANLKKIYIYLSDFRGVEPVFLWISLNLYLHVFMSVLSIMFSRSVCLLLHVSAHDCVSMCVTIHRIPAAGHRSE